MRVDVQWCHLVSSSLIILDEFYLAMALYALQTMLPKIKHFVDTKLSAISFRHSTNIRYDIIMISMLF